MVEKSNQKKEVLFQKREGKKEAGRYKGKLGRNELAIENNRLGYVFRRDTSLPSFPCIHHLGPVFLHLAITSIISSESQQSWHLACILSVDNFTFLHELNVYSITAPRPGLDKGILMDSESGSTRN